MEADSQGFTGLVFPALLVEVTLQWRSWGVGSLVGDQWITHFRAIPHGQLWVWDERSQRSGDWVRPWLASPLSCSPSLQLGWIFSLNLSTTCCGTLEESLSLSGVLFLSVWQGGPLSPPGPVGMICSFLPMPASHPTPSPSPLSCLLPWSCCLLL